MTGVDRARQTVADGFPADRTGTTTPVHAAFRRRVLRRETRASRSGTVVLAVVLLLVVAAVATTAAALVLLDQRLLGVDPRDVVETAARAPLGLDTTAVVGIGVVVAAVGVVLLLRGLLPRRRARHTLPSDRLAVVVDDEVLASAAARAARSAARLAPDAAVASVGRRTVEVVLRPAAGVDVVVEDAAEAVAAELETFDAQPPLTSRVRVRPSGRVAG